MILAIFACTPDTHEVQNLATRAYVVSEESNELFVFDYATLTEVGIVDTTVFSGTINANHMAMVSPDGSKVFVTASAQDTLVVVDAATLTVKKTGPIGKHAGHMAVREGTSELWIMAEDDNAVVVYDMDTEQVTHTLTDASFQIPHFARFSGDYAYIPSIGGNQISIVDLHTYQVIDTLVPDGLTEGACENDPCGFADAQISSTGILFASHFSTGKILIYDTLAHTDLSTDLVSPEPWSAFVDPFDAEGDFAFVPSWTTSTIHRVQAAGVASAWAAGSSEVYGVNFSPTAPDEAFVLNRTQSNIRVLDKETGTVLQTLDAGGTTETGTTTPDGRLLLPISSTGEVLVYDTATHQELTRFSGVGTYPWSVATLEGQNYCH